MSISFTTLDSRSRIRGGSMAKKHKKGVFCGKCDHECTWYKRGKKRVLVCPKCGIIAHNPVPWATIGKVAGSFVPGGSIIGEIAGSSLEGLSAGKQKSEKRESAQIQIIDDKDKPNLTREDYYVDKVIRGEKGYGK